MLDKFLIRFTTAKIGFMNFKNLFHTNFENQLKYFQTDNFWKY